MKKVLLINPPLYYSNGIPFALDVSVPPLGLLYLASYINNYTDKIRAEVIDIAAENISLESLWNKVVKSKPYSVGITAMTPQLQGAVELADFLKHNYGEVKIFLGGPHISADPGFVQRHGYLFDYGITGEAEITLLESLERLIAGKKIPRIQTGKAVMDLDTIPLPDRSLIKRDRYSQYESMMYSRGCPYHCYYCSRPSISKITRYRSVKNMIDEIKLTYNDCQGKIDFQDDTFTLSREKVMGFCQAVTGENLNLDWRCNTRIDLVDEELLAAMKKAGCSLIHFGIESGNEKIRKEIVKKGQFTNKQIYKVFHGCKKYKIKVAGYFMIGHPQETKKDIEETAEMILNSGIDLLGLSIPIPFPGSKLYEIAKKRGIVNEEIIDKFAKKELGEGYVGNYPIFVSEMLSEDYIYLKMQEINRKFYVNIKVFWSRLCQDIFSPLRLKQDFLDLLSLALKGISSRKPYIKR